MTKKTDDKIFVGIDNQIIELLGANKDSFIEQQLARQTEINAQQTQFEESKALRISAYTKLGLTTEEIDSIL